MILSLMIAAVVLALALFVAILWSVAKDQDPSTAPADVRHRDRSRN